MGPDRNRRGTSAFCLYSEPCSLPFSGPPDAADAARLHSARICKEGFLHTHNIVISVKKGDVDLTTLLTTQALFYFILFFSGLFRKAAGVCCAFCLRATEPHRLNGAVVPHRGIGSWTCTLAPDATQGRPQQRGGPLFLLCLPLSLFPTPGKGPRQGDGACTRAVAGAVGSALWVRGVFLQRCLSKCRLVHTEADGLTVLEAGSPR